MSYTTPHHTTPHHTGLSRVRADSAFFYVSEDIDAQLAEKALEASNLGPEQAASAAAAGQDPNNPVYPELEYGVLYTGFKLKTWGNLCLRVGAVYSQFGRIVGDPVFTCVVLGLSCLYFVVTGVQYWATDYLIAVQGGSRYVVMSLFVVTSATAPILGVFAGGWIIDNLVGGYKGSLQRRRATRCCVAFGLAANAFGIPATFGPHGSIVYVVVCLWGLLFFGGACLPALTGIFIDTCERRDKAMASSISQISFNLLGYFASPFFSGWIMGFLEQRLDSCKGTDPGKCVEAFSWVRLS